jgi:hypothetical protein
MIKTGYSKQATKAFCVSPDAWEHLLIQLAYARLLHPQGCKRQGETNGRATTRRFFEGCTEVVRVVTSKSDVFVLAKMAEDDVEEAEVENRRFPASCGTRGGHLPSFVR